MGLYMDECEEQERRSRLHRGQPQPLETGFAWHALEARFIPPTTMETHEPLPRRADYDRAAQLTDGALVAAAQGQSLPEWVAAWFGSAEQQLEARAVRPCERWSGVGSHGVVA